MVHSLAKDEIFAALSEQEKTMVSERILEEVRGRMMEEIVLLETFKSAEKHSRVFKLTFSVGEYDIFRDGIFCEKNYILQMILYSTILYSEKVVINIIGNCKTPLILSGFADID